MLGVCDIGCSTVSSPIPREMAELSPAAQQRDANSRKLMLRAVPHGTRGQMIGDSMTISKNITGNEIKKRKNSSIAGMHASASSPC